MICLQENIGEQLLGIDEVKITNIIQKPSCTIVEVELKNKEIKVCPCCGNDVIYLHDKRVREIKDIPLFGKPLYIHLTEYRYQCSKCKRKLKKNPKFVAKRSRISDRLKLKVYEKAATNVTATDIGKELNISTNTVCRLIDKIDIKRKTLPEAMCIDEFKGDSGKEKYQVSLGDAKNHEIIDILPSRKILELSKYFGNIKKKNE